VERAESVVALRDRVARFRRAGARVALVPTMGGLHAGHLRLVEEARQQADRVIASVFVNPTQFGANEDFDRYPRQLDADAAMLEGAGCDLLFAPPVLEVYPPGFETSVRVARLGESWCGAARPGHFDGVATVVAKLLNMAMPDVALFGEKDWQQLCIVRRLVRDLDLQVAIVGVPTVRDADGLALSSRNTFLTADERARAAALPRALHAAAQACAAGAPAADALASARQALLEAGFHAIDYLALVDEDTLEPLEQLRPGQRGARILAAARIGQTRLIDNLPVPAAEAQGRAS
jgi:pantoate--beta-alanine ligase